MTKTENQRPKTKDRFVWLTFALLIAAVYFFGLTIPLVGPDEPRYAQIAREMWLRGDWITPKLGGFDWFEKPALLYWLQIFFYKIFGVSEFAARFGSALFGLGTVFSLWILGKAVQGSRFEVRGSDEKSNSDFADWLALIAASSIGLIAFSHGASFDIILTFPITASLVAFFIFDCSEKKSGLTFYFSLVAFYFFIGIALLAKGLIGIVFPLAIIGFYHLLSLKLPNKTFVLSLFWGTLFSLLVALVWYLPMYQTNGWKFIDDFFIQHHFQRYTSNKYQHPQPFYFFFWVLPLMTLPWLPFFLAAIWHFFKAGISNFRLRASGSKSEIQNFTQPSIFNSRLSTFAFAWLSVPLVFFTFSGSKLPGYILPALPAALILTAEYVWRFARNSQKTVRALRITAFSTLVVIIILLQFAVPKYAEQDSVKGLVETANAKGYATEKIVNLYTISHNLEFYAPGRLMREPDGKQKLYDNFSVLVDELKTSENGRILVLVPRKDLANVLRENALIEKTVLGENGEDAIVLLQSK